MDLNERVSILEAAALQLDCENDTCTCDIIRKCENCETYIYRENLAIQLMNLSNELLEESCGGV